MCLRRTTKRNVSWPFVTRYEQHEGPLKRSFLHQKVFRLRDAERRRLEDRRRRAVPRGVEHGAGEDFGRGDVVGKQARQQRKQRPRDGVGDAVQLRLRGLAVHRQNRGRPEHVRGLERQPQQRVLGRAFDARPHRPALFAAVGAAAGHIDKGHLRIEPRQRGGGGEGEVVGDAAIFVFRLPRCGDAEAEEAGVVAGEVGLDVGVVVEIGADDLAQFRMLLSCDSPAD